MKIRDGFVSNSSSSSFICLSKVSAKTAETRLRALLDVYNFLMSGKCDKYVFEKTFQTPFVVNSHDKRSKEYKEQMEGWIFDKDSPYKNVRVGNSFGASSVIGKESDLNGKLIINSVDDNTIPCSLYELIEEAFDGSRLHLG
jgi:hypothetical protein